MSVYKSILVHLDDQPRCGVRQDLALGLASRFDSHITGFGLSHRDDTPAYVRDMLPEEVLQAQRKASEDRLARAGAAFHDAARRAGVDKLDWRILHGDPVEVAASTARFADLLVVGQTDPEQDEWYRLQHFPELVILAAGRPVMVIPYAGSFPTLGERVLVAWNGTREAARAVTDAMPLLQSAQQVVVLSVNDPASDDDKLLAPGLNLAEYLARHSVRASASEQKSGDIGVADWLLSRVADMGADLLVMGAYGHSRLRELILGGVTQDMLGQMTIPVLMTH